MSSLDNEHLLMRLCVYSVHNEHQVLLDLCFYKLTPGGMICTSLLYHPITLPTSFISMGLHMVLLLYAIVPYLAAYTVLVY